MSIVDPAGQLARLSTWIDVHPPNAERDPEAALWGRVAKVGEEFGEVIAAMIGSTGQNPRKGVTHDRGQVEVELLDVAVTALAAVEHMHGNNGMALWLFERHLDAVHERALGGGS